MARLLYTLAVVALLPWAFFHLVWRSRRHVTDRVTGMATSRTDDALKPGAGRVSLPAEYAAHAMVFRTFDRVSYALVMEGTKPARVGKTRCPNWRARS